MKKLVSTVCLLSSVFCSQAMAADADKYSSWYVGTDLNLSVARDHNVKGTTDGKVSYKPSVSLSDLKVGYRPQALYSDAGDVRFELELLGRSLGVDKVTDASVSSKPKSDLNIGALMANAYYDMHTKTSFTPYIGAGVGYAAYSFHKSPGFGIGKKDDKDSVFAGQLMTGVSYTPQSMPSTTWSLGYNVFMAGKPEFKNAAVNEKFSRTVVSSAQIGFQYHF